MSSRNSRTGGMSSFSISLFIRCVAKADTPGIAPITVGNGIVIGRPSIGMAMFSAELPTVDTLRLSSVLFASAFRPKKVKNSDASMPSMRAPFAMISAG